MAYKGSDQYASLEPAEEIFMTSYRYLKKKISVSLYSVSNNLCSNIEYILAVEVHCIISQQLHILMVRNLLI